MDSSSVVENKASKITDDRRAIHMSIGIALIFFGDFCVVESWSRVQYFPKLCGAHLWYPFARELMNRICWCSRIRLNVSDRYILFVFCSLHYFSFFL